jgi:Zn-finger nucleic acid-binding protein
MKCPSCPDSELVMSDRQGIEIDYCPKCRGVWLDRGELDKLIERSTATSAAQPRRPGPYHDRDWDDDDDDHRHYGRRRSWLSEFFD